MTWMLRNSRNRPDALLTFSAGAVAVVLVKTLLSGVVAFGVTFGSIDSVLAGVVLGATLGAYTAKRTTVDRDHATSLPSSASATPPPRGYATPAFMLLLCVLAGFGLYALAHRTAVVVGFALLAAWVVFAARVLLAPDGGCTPATWQNRVLRAFGLRRKNTMYGTFRNWLACHRRSPPRYHLYDLLPGPAARAVLGLLDRVRPVLTFSRDGRLFYASGAGMHGFWLGVDVRPAGEDKGDTSFAGGISYADGTWRRVFPFTFYEVKSGKHEAVWGWHPLARLYRAAAAARDER